ncbi:anaerobic glycerol-3-phosphate dehydrogenase subunit C [Chrysiogenes arsenatis]|uniref:anaerobic glycerol-3-phosphate dehydrogenase subunit C n=1 Tax=Chrysiogenes arsenatis TaxID=309797 RepID=UPI0004018603|nr:anaerobic glycerol-3-phosphate dehydrogenase subunit C [Chrysiogenes arsenatis]
MDTNLIAEELNSLIQGDVYFDQATRCLFSTDASIYQVMPLGVVYPKDDVDIQHVLRFATQKGIQIHARGAGSAIGGQSLGCGIVLDFLKYRHAILEINRAGYAWVEPGVRYADLNKAAKQYGLYFPPDPSSGNYCTVGGMIANNTSGAHSIKYGITGEYVEELEVVLHNGEKIHLKPRPVDSIEMQSILTANTLEAAIYRGVMATIEECRDLIAIGYPDIRYNVCGYNLRGVYQDGVINLVPLIVGSEGTLATIVRAKIRLNPIPKHTVLGMAMFRDIASSGEATVIAVNSGAAAVEILDSSLVKKARAVDPVLDKNLPAELDNVLMIEFDGDDLGECEALLEAVRKEIMETNTYAFRFDSARTPQEQESLWAIRKAAVPLANKLKGDAKAIGFVEDAAVPLHNLVEYYREVYECSARHGVEFSVYGHAGKGLLHVRPILNMKKPEDIAKFRKISQELFRVVERLNGTPCGEHGDGRVRSRYIKCLYPNLFPYFLKIKDIFDPKHLLNPDVKTNPDDEADTRNLRYGAEYRPVVDTKRTVLHWAEEGADYQAQIEMCHGCSTCMTVDTVVTMCPMYKLKRDEKAAPKAKANMLRHLIQGNLDPATFPYSAEAKEIMDQCITCQSCYHECVSNVNIPKLMLEAKARYVARNGQTFQNKVLTAVERTARLNSSLASLVNPLLKTTLMRTVMDATVGVAKERSPLIFHKETAVKYASTRSHLANPIRKVVYFTGCAANYMQTDVAKAAIRVLEHNNIHVEVPEQHCCGLPKLSNGSAKEARYDVISNAGIFAYYVKKGYDIITTCTSCNLSLKEEWLYTTENDDTHLVARNTWHISEYLLKLAEENLLKTDFSYTMPERVTSFSYHTPCHLKVQKIRSTSVDLLRMVPGLQFHVLQAGCCGMSGSWGMKKQNYATSVAIGKNLGETIAAIGTDGITDCPTCRMQIQDLARGKDGHHPIQILASAYGLKS